MTSDPAMAAALADCAAGRATPAIALMRLILASPDTESCLSAIRDAAGEPSTAEGAGRLAHLARLAQEHPDAFARVRATAAAVPHGTDRAGDPAALVAAWAERFDRAAAISPEASVALYSLGDPGRLDAATADIMAVLAGHGLVAPERRVLDYGCGIGRLSIALAPQVRSVLALDVSTGMVDEARRRTAHLSNVSVERTGGVDLSGVPDHSVDTIAVVDAMPYCVAAGLEGRLFGEFARVLAPGGGLAVANHSYRDDLDLDRRDVLGLAQAVGLDAVILGERPFETWDGALFILMKPH